MSTSALEDEDEGVGFFEGGVEREDVRLLQLAAGAREVVDGKQRWCDWQTVWSR